MRKIAFTAVLFALLAAAANIHLVGADSGHKVATKHQTVNTKNLKDSKSSKPGTTKPAPAAATVAAAPQPVMVTVQSGDSLSSIASAHGTTASRLFDANPSLANPDSLHVGQQLRVPTASETLTHRVIAQAAPVTTPKAVVATHKTQTAAKTTAATSYPAVAGNAAKAFIYAHESGNNPNATNAKGCYGLGQDCNGVVRAKCGADYACQDAYFTAYANSRYGGWGGALAFWQSHHWW
jgi:LysM repeat protein